MNVEIHYQNLILNDFKLEFSKNESKIYYSLQFEDNNLN